MPVTIGKKPENDFTNPLGMLSDCHRRIERFLNILITVAEQAQGARLSGEQREALEASLRYFQRAAPKHTGDEEESLFPRMLATRDPQIQAALARIDSLRADHERTDTGHRKVEELGHRWLVEGSLPEEETRCLIETLQGLEAIYREHIAIEDNEVFPLARGILGRDEVEAIGREMAARRGLDPERKV
jgi:hemerythrin-like domain-containing protein